LPGRIWLPGHIGAQSLLLRLQLAELGIRRVLLRCKLGKFAITVADCPFGLA